MLIEPTAPSPNSPRSALLHFRKRAYLGMKPLLASLALALTAFAQPPQSLEEAFRSTEVGTTPVGVTRGTVLSADGAFPRLKAAVQGTIWKGKVFNGDGTFTNRWLGGIRAGTVATTEDASWADGRPVLSATYSPTALVFRYTRDELREVSPGVWLGHSYDTRTGATKNWFVLRGR